MWTDREKEEALTIHRNLGAASKSFDVMDEADYGTFMEIYSNTKMKNIQKERHFAAEQSKSLLAVHDTVSSSLHVQSFPAANNSLFTMKPPLLTF